jgi:2-polyprenyl-3-methyl-5-hydroxy-6-metoxy-1,4-benzoquinol methylase
MNKIIEKDQEIEQINNTRVYGQKTDIDVNNVKSFWTKRAKVESINSVLLGTDLQKDINILRNQKELDLLKSILPKKKFNILDVGCGMGRWAKKFIPRICKHIYRNRFN